MGLACGGDDQNAWGTCPMEVSLKIREGEMMDHSAIQAEVDKNYEAFQKLLPELIEEHNGRFALMRGEKVVHIFDTVRDAVVFAKEKYDDDLFSVQKISEQAVDLGIQFISA